MAQTVKNLPAMQEIKSLNSTQIQSLGWEDPLEKGMAVFLPREFQGQESDGLQSMGSQRVGHNWATLTFRLYKGIRCNQTGVKDFII